MHKYISSFYRISLLALMGVFILGQFGRFELPLGKAIYFQDIILSLFLAVFFFEKPKRILHFLKTCRLVQLLVILNLWILLTMLFHFQGRELLSPILYLVRFDVIILFGRSLYTLLRKKIITFKQVETGVSLSIAGITLSGLLQYVFVPDTRFLKLLGWDDHYYRLISTIFDAGFTGMILVIGCILGVLSILRMIAPAQEKNGEKIHTQRRLFLSLSFFTLTSVALLLTYSRASYVAFATAILYLIVLTRKTSLFLLVMLMAGLLFLLPRPGGEGVKLLRTASITARIDSMTSSVTDFTPIEVLIGKGWYNKKVSVPTSRMGEFVLPNHSSAPENSYLFVFNSLGLVGVVLWGMLLFGTLHVLSFEKETTTVFLAVGVHALFTNTFFHPFILLLLVVITAKNAVRVLAPSQPEPR